MLYLVTITYAKNEQASSDIKFRRTGVGRNVTPSGFDWLWVDWLWADWLAPRAGHQARSSKVLTFFTQLPPRPQPSSHFLPPSITGPLEASITKASLYRSAGPPPDHCAALTIRTLSAS